MLSQHNFLSTEEVAKARDAVHQLRNHWVNRATGMLPFYTLGVASYKDAMTADKEIYLQEAKRFNTLLNTHFSWLYERLITHLTDILQMPVCFTENYALPGFHIFLAHKAFKIPLATPHFDLQYKLLKWNTTQINTKQLVSFTCAVALPQSKAGMFYWPITYEESQTLSLPDLEALQTTRGINFFKYELGKLALHQGLILHQIAPAKRVHPSDERITLQGHGIVCDGIMHLYW